MKNRNTFLIILLVALIILVVGTTYAFFNYTRKGAENTISVGRIYFHTNQAGTISLTNIFPVASNSVVSNSSNTVTVDIEGDTTYSGGIEYLVTIDEVNNTINNKQVPISFKATQSNLGTSSDTYWTSRGGNAPIYELTSEGEASEGKYVMVGYIPSGSQGVNGSISITAFLDTNKVAITDTVENGPISVNGYENGTDTNWINGRMVITADEWNSFATSPLSFKVRVEANEGIWVEKEKFLTMKNLNSITEWNNIKNNITSIEFHKDGLAPVNYVTSFDVTDSTSDVSKGSITLYTVDDGLGNNTYKAIVVANDTIYAPEDCMRMFYGMTNLVTFNSTNFRVDNAKYINIMFTECTSLTNVDFLLNWNTSNVIDMSAVFTNCTSLVNVNGLRNWNTGKVVRMSNTFGGCNALEDISALASWNTENVTTMIYTFSSCTKLRNISALANWNVSSVNDFSSFFEYTYYAETSSINNWDIDPTANFTGMCRYVIAHPEFSKVSGTWGNFADGTFTPNI